MNVLNYIKEKVNNIFNFKKLNAEFLQYYHMGTCSAPCGICYPKHLKIYKNGEEVSLPAHYRCDCKYNNIKTQSAGTISDKGIYSPDVYLKSYGVLPNYYITKQEAEEKYGWQQGKNLSLFIPNKMIGGDIFYNRKGILPEKEGRIWYECDVDYENGKRNSKRLYYSNDGLMFYSEVHNEAEVIFIK